MGWVTRIQLSAGADVFFFIIVSRLSLGYTQLAVQWVIMGLAFETGHSPSSGAKVKNMWSYTFISPYILV
jgi:hypothetical protein